VRATNAVGHRFRERSVIDPRRTRDAEKRPQCLRVGVETLPQHGVPDVLEALNLRIAWDQVVERGSIKVRERTSSGLWAAAIRVPRTT
jgi:hypothetical protein